MALNIEFFIAFASVESFFKQLLTICVLNKRRDDDDDNDECIQTWKTEKKRIKSLA